MVIRGCWVEGRKLEEAFLGGRVFKGPASLIGGVKLTTTNRLFYSVSRSFGQRNFLQKLKTKRREAGLFSIAAKLDIHDLKLTDCAKV